MNYWLNFIEAFTYTNNMNLPRFLKVWCGILPHCLETINAHYKIRIFENNGYNSYIERTPIIWLPPNHPADFANGDFDGDGNNEVVCGGIYGHLAIQENVADDSFEVTWQGELGHPNALLHENIGDYDEDGRDEWVSAGKDFSAGGFFFGVFNSIGNNQYEAVYYDSLPGNTWDAGGISAGDVDGDGINEFLVSSNNNIGLFKYSSNRGWDCVWLTDEGGTGAVETLPFLLDIILSGRRFTIWFRHILINISRKKPM